jgi:hypothetical protein
MHLVAPESAFDKLRQRNFLAGPVGEPVLHRTLFSAGVEPTCTRSRRNLPSTSSGSGIFKLVRWVSLSNPHTSGRAVFSAGVEPTCTWSRRNLPSTSSGSGIFKPVRWVSRSCTARSSVQVSNPRAPGRAGICLRHLHGKTSCGAGWLRQRNFLMSSCGAGMLRQRTSQICISP